MLRPVPVRPSLSSDSLPTVPADPLAAISIADLDRLAGVICRLLRSAYPKSHGPATLLTMVHRANPDTDGRDVDELDAAA